MKQKQFSSKRAIKNIVLSAFFIALFWGGIHFVKTNSYRFFADYFSNLNYHPSKLVKDLSSQIDLSDESVRIFYASRPEILGKAEFSDHCKNQLEETSVLGCYKNGFIYIFNVDNEELSGVVQVTAAHEFLHAAWHRFSEEERSRLGELLKRDYERLKTPELEQIMKNYAVTQPGEHENELHSILGTEFSNLSPELELHYAKYFKNRRKIVEYYEKYSQKFKELEAKIAKLKSEIENRSKQIQADREFYSQSVVEYERAVDRFNDMAVNGGFSSQTEFYNQRSILVSRREKLDHQRLKLSQDISSLNKNIDELNSLIIRSNNLHQSIDSKLSSPTK